MDLFQVVLAIKKITSNEIEIQIAQGSYTGNYSEPDGTVKSANDFNEEEYFAYSNHKVRTFAGDLTKDNNGVFKGKMLDNVEVCLESASEWTDY